MLQHFRITGSARMVPAHLITADELDRRLGLAPGTTLHRTGIRHRYEAREPENASTMTRVVVEQALQEAGCSLREVDQIIDASLCVQQPIPCNAALLQEALGAEAAGIPCIDVHASCLGFVAALNVANGLFASGAVRRILVVCAETPLRGVNWDEPESACLMGDAAVAFVLEATPPLHPCVLRMETYAEGAQLCTVEGGGHRLPPFAYSREHHAKYCFHMEGREVHKMAARYLPELVKRVLREAKCELADLEIVPHQASGPAIELTARRLGFPAHRLHATIAEHGNLVAASIPYVLHQVRRTRPTGTRVLLLGTAAGYTQAACVLTL